MSDKKFSLERTKQCAKCPWKKSVNPRDIPGGYCENAHKGLSCTIALPGTIGGTLKAMACHESPVKSPYYCVGWLYNQLGPGNNLGLRLQMRMCSNLSELQIFGPQHERFKDTLPD